MKQKVVETASDIGFRQSPRVSDDGAISLPAIRVGAGGGKRDGGGSVWKNAPVREGITSEMLTAHERDERIAAERRERSLDVVRRRKELSALTARVAMREPKGEDGWLEEVMVEDEEDARLESMYRHSSLASRFNQIKGGGMRA